MVTLLVVFFLAFLCFDGELSENVLWCWTTLNVVTSCLIVSACSLVWNLPQMSIGDFRESDFPGTHRTFPFTVLWTRVFLNLTLMFIEQRLDLQVPHYVILHQTLAFRQK